jgi:hypothetical protein
MSVFNPALTGAEARRSHTHSKTLAAGVAKMFPSRFVVSASFNDVFMFNPLYFGH